LKIIKRLTIPFMFLLSCSGVDNIDILIDQDGTGHFYNTIGLFNQDSTRLWCYTHEQFETVKKDTNKTKDKDWQKFASSYSLF
tara:strand:+ start:190 stop:438 length:249 start_codon:yes stop_codon:yes gene_type:complete